MPRINLSGGSYQARGASVACQRLLNLYAEPLAQSDNEPIQYAQYPTPGSKLFAQLSGTIRCLYTDSTGTLIAVDGSSVWTISRAGQATKLGQISTGSSQVRMQDNGLVCVVVDGSGSGWYFTLPTTVAAGASGPVTGYGPITQIAASDTAFYGSATIGILDTFLLLVQPGGQHWYVSPAEYAGNSTPFDGPATNLYIAGKTSYPDLISGIAVVGQAIWIFGIQTTELWYDSGASDFPFQRDPSITADIGCEAPYSIATDFGTVFWLGRDRSGHARVYSGSQNISQPISTFAIEQMLQGYGDLSGAIGNTYQQDGHQFYVLTIPGQSSTWVYDAGTQLWHERCSLDANGNEIQLRANAWAAAYGMVFCGDNANGMVYQVDAAFLDENGTPIKRQRAFPHLLTNGTRGVHRRFGLDMQNGSGVTVNVDFSDDRGATFCAPIGLPLGGTGNVWPTLWRLGIARDRVYRLTWSGDAQTALMGAFIDIDPMAN